MKTCTTCKQSLPLAAFGKLKTTQDGLNYFCKDCANQKARKGHQRRIQDPAYQEKHRDRLRVRAQAKKAWVVNRVFGGSCYDCGESYPPCVFDFHHENDGDDKADNPSAFINRNKMEAALLESEKCVMLCANCHRMRHFHNKDEE